MLMVNGILVQHMNLNKWILLAVPGMVLACAFLIRYGGINYGFPIIIHPDEAQVVFRSLDMIFRGDLNPHFFSYPSLLLYILAAIFSGIHAIGQATGAYGAFTDIPIPTLHYWGRMLIILLSVFTVYAVYYAGSLLFRKWIATVSALFITVSFLHIQNSFIITVDSPMAFFISAAFCFSILIWSRGSRLRYYLLNGLFIGLAVGTKYTACFAVLPMILAHVFKVRENGKPVIDRKIIIGLLVIPAVFLVTTPYAILDFKAFFEAVRNEGVHYRSGHAGHDSYSVSYGYYLNSLVNKYGLFPLILAFAGATGLAVRNYLTALICISFPLAFFLFIGSYTVHFDRNIVSLIPFLALFSGFGLQTMFGLAFSAAAIRKPWIGHAASMVILILCIYGVYDQSEKSFENLRIINLPDTRWISKLWVEDHLPPGSVIGEERTYSPIIDHGRFRVDRLDQYGFIKNPLKNYDFIITSSGNYERFLENPEKYPVAAERYREILSSHTLLVEFKGDNINLSGPDIRVYQVLKSEPPVQKNHKDKP